jgi:hypothetical protein
LTYRCWPQCTVIGPGLCVFRGVCTTDFRTTCTTNIGRSGAAEPVGITFQGDAWVQEKRDSPYRGARVTSIGRSQSQLSGDVLRALIDIEHYYDVFHGTTHVSGRCLCRSGRRTGSLSDLMAARR